MNIVITSFVVLLISCSYCIYRDILYVSVVYCIGELLSHIENIIIVIVSVLSDSV
jgi:hypothetical protein